MKSFFSICLIVVTILALGALCPAGEEQHHVCFKIIDADKDGKVTFEEFKQFYNTDREKFAAVDANGDGHLSHDEYHRSLGHGAERKLEK